MVAARVPVLGVDDKLPIQFLPALATDAELRKCDADAFFNGTVYPTRLSVTTDTTRRVRWIGPITNPPTIGSGYAISGFDVWEVTP